MNSKELYQKAFELHYTVHDYERALELYEQILREEPNSPEAGYCKHQIAEIDAIIEEEMPNDRANEESSFHAAGSSGQQTSDVPSIVVTDIRMSFGSMVSFMVKWSIASIPALIILTLIFAAIGAVFGGLFAAFLR